MTLKSLKDFTQTGPRLRDEILTRFRLYTVFSVLRLALAAFAIMAFMAGAGVFLSEVAAAALGVDLPQPLAALGGVVGLAGAIALQFFRALVRNPGLLVASMQYRTSRLYPALVEARSRIHLAGHACGGRGARAADGRGHLAPRIGGRLGADARYLAGARVLRWDCVLPRRGSQRHVSHGGRRSAARPNIIMIGSDTLRADRLGAAGYRRRLTPTLDRLAASGVQFTECFVPCARTAPSLISLLTGTWPHHHGIRDNFVSESETDLR